MSDSRYRCPASLIENIKLLWLNLNFIPTFCDIFKKSLFDLFRVLLHERFRHTRMHNILFADASSCFVQFVILLTQILLNISLHQATGLLPNETCGLYLYF